MDRITAALVLLFFVSASMGLAQTASVEVREVAFDRVRDRTGGEWWQAKVILRVDAQGGQRGRFANQVRVQFNLATQGPGQERELSFYRAAATAPVLEAGEHAFRFYLPPALVRRDRLQPNARFWTVNLSVAGARLPLMVEGVSRDFSSRPAVDNFERQVEEFAPSNDGVMLPQHLTPWALDAEAPVVVRPEAFDRER